MEQWASGKKEPGVRPYSIVNHGKDLDLIILVTLKPLKVLSTRMMWSNLYFSFCTDQTIEQEGQLVRTLLQYPSWEVIACLYQVSSDGGDEKCLYSGYTFKANRICWWIRCRILEKRRNPGGPYDFWTEPLGYQWCPLPVWEKFNNIGRFGEAE